MDGHNSDMDRDRPESHMGGSNCDADSKNNDGDSNSSDMDNTNCEMNCRKLA